MRLGILVATDRHRDALIGIAREALKRGHEVEVFFNDTASLLLGDPEVAGLAKMDALSMAYCELRANHHGVKAEQVARGIKKGSQFDNARMFSRADKVICL